MKKESTVKSIISNLSLDTLLIYPLQIIVGVLIARYLGPELKGVQSYIVAFVTILVPIAQFGLPNAARYFIAQDIKNSKKVISPTIFWVGIFMILATLLFVTLWRFSFLGTIGNNISSLNIFITSVIIFVTSINIISQKIYFSLNLFHRNNILKLITVVVYLICVVFLCSAMDFQLEGVLLALLISKLTYLCLNINTLRGYLTKKIRYSINFSNFKSYSLKTWINEIALYGNNRIDQILIGTLMSPENLGFYSIAVLVSELTQKFHQSYIQIVFNKVVTQNNDLERINFFYLANKFAMYSSVLIATFLVCFGEYVINLLFGDNYSVSYTIILYYIPGTILYSSTRLFLQFFSAIGKPQFCTYIQTISLIVSIPSYIIGINKFGIIGAAISSSFAYLISIFVSVFLLKMEYPNFSLKHMLLIRKLEIVKIKSILNKYL